MRLLKGINSNPKTNIILIISQNQSSYFLILCASYVIDALLRVPVMLPSSNTQLLKKTAMVRHYWLVINADTMFLRKSKHSSMSPVAVKGNGPAWASGVNSNDYELICPKKTPVPVTDFVNCHLAAVPAHAVVTRPEIRSRAVTTLQSQQVSDEFFSHLYFLTVSLTRYSVTQRKSSDLRRTIFIRFVEEL